MLPVCFSCSPENKQQSNTVTQFSSETERDPGAPPITGCDQTARALRPTALRDTDTDTVRPAEMEDQNSTAPTPEQSSGSDLHDSALSVVEELVYWRDVRRSALVFGGSLLVLISLATFSFISVLSYLLLAMLCITITFRVYKSIIQAVQKSDEGHPFKVLLERNISITPEMAHRYTDIILLNLNRALIQTRRLLLVEDVVDSLKLAGLMWVLTYVGAVFNGVTLLILADVVFFCTPLVYEKNKTQIDRYVELVRTQLEEKLEKLQEKLPGAVQLSKTD
ncbi:hypothetical protein MHYP_G00207450 [Metynnis hypsauchen]